LSDCRGKARPRPRDLTPAGGGFHEAQLVRFRFRFVPVLRARGGGPDHRPQPGVGPDGDAEEGGRGGLRQGRRVPERLLRPRPEGLHPEARRRRPRRSREVRRRRRLQRRLLPHHEVRAQPVRLL